MNERYSSEMEYHPKALSLGVAAVRLIFQPSDRLELSLNEFVEPEERRKYGALLKSDLVKSLHYTGGDSNGLRYLNINDSQEGLSDREWLRHYKQTVEQVKSQSISVAAYRPRLERTKSGALVVELALLPSDAIKRKIGSTILRTLRIHPSDHTPDEVIYARTLIPQSILKDAQGIKDAQEKFMDHLGVVESHHKGTTSDLPHESPKVERMFVKVAYVSDRPVSKY